MTKKIMLINVADDESRVSIVEDALLQEMLIEHRTKEQIKNNIYKATVVQVQTSLQAAFVDFGDKKHGFLPSSEIHPNLFYKKNTSVNSPIQQKIKPGQSFLVQVTREAVDQKGAALTTNITIPGRFMVLMPNSNKGGVSKKIDTPDERDRLKSFLSGIESEKHAVIIRTAGYGRDLGDLKKDYTSLKKSWDEVQTKFKKLRKPGLVLEEADVVTRTLRDYYTEDIEEIWVDNPEIFQKTLEFIKQVAPRKQKTLKLFVGDRSLFSTYHVERQVEQLSSREIKLPSGGSIVIEQTEALVAIDVNSGKSNQEANIDSTALRTNLEAAAEIARQIRLRNLGGLIVVDFIDMEHEDARKKVEEELKNSMERDKAHRKYNPISQFGLLEFSRQRLAVGISNTVESVCPTCGGKGRISSLLASTNLIIRAIREMAASANLIRIEGELPLELANNLLNERRQSIADLELEFGIKILLRGNPNITAFEEKQLVAISDKGQPAKKTKPDSEKDKPKDTSGKKKQRRKDKEKPKDEGDKPQARKTSDEEQAPDKAEDSVEAKATPDKEAKASSAKKPNQKPVESKSQRQVEPGGIHPSCLFTDVKELESEELAEITTNFENRLKGKAADKPIPLIDTKYLWKNETDKSPDAPAPTELNDDPGSSALESSAIADGPSEDAEPSTTAASDNVEEQPVEVKSQREKKKSAPKKQKGSPRKKTKSKSDAEKAAKKTKPQPDDIGTKPVDSEEEQANKDEKKAPVQRKRKSATTKSKPEKTATKDAKSTAKKAKPGRKPEKKVKDAQKKAVDSAEKAPEKKAAPKKKPVKKDEGQTTAKKSTKTKGKQTRSKADKKPAEKPKPSQKKRTASKKKTDIENKTD